MARYFFLLLLIFFFIAFPGVTHAAEWWEFWNPLTKLWGDLANITDTLAALKNIIANIGTFIILLFTGIPMLFAIAAAVTYTVMFFLAALSTAVFAIMKELISQTLSVLVVPGPGAAEVVSRGWEISRDIASMFFIAILAFIGLATILGMQSYQVKKLLPALLIMALLLNFSALPVGFVVDMSNLLASGFINAMNTTDPIVSALDATSKELEALIRTVPERIFKDDPITFFLSFLTPVLGAAARAIFYFFFILALLAICFLFIIRIGILWMLTILAPLAFAAYVLPATRKFWTQWWQNLFQWALMAVPMSFFLYLAFLINAIPTNIEFGVNYAAGGWFAVILKSFIKPLLILLFLLVGFVISMTFVPGAARGLVERGGKFMTGTVAVGAGALAAKRLGPQFEKLGAKLTGPRKTEAEIAKMGRLEKFGWGVRQRYGAPLEMAGREAVSRVERKETVDVEKQKEQFKKMGAGEILNRFKMSVKPSSRAAALWALSERDPAKFAEYIKGNEIKGEDVTKAGALLWNRGHKQFAASNPSDAMAAAIDPKGWAEAQKNIESGKALHPPILYEYGELNDKLAVETDPAKKAQIQAELARILPQVQSTIGAMTPQEEKDLEKGIDLITQGKQKKIDIKGAFAQVIKDPTQLSAAALKDPSFVGAAVNTWTGDKIGRAATHFGKEVADAFQKEINKKGKDIFKDNGPLALWLTGGAAANAGLHLPSAINALTQKEVRQEMINARISAEKRMDRQTALLERFFRNNPQLLMRDYHRPGTTEEMKKAIAGAIQNLGRTIPTKEEVNSRIGKAEKIIDENTREATRRRTKLHEARQKYQTAGSPTSGPEFIAWTKMQTITNQRLNEINASIKKAEQNEAISLKKLWK